MVSDLHLNLYYKFFKWFIILCDYSLALIYIIITSITSTLIELTTNIFKWQLANIFKNNNNLEQVYMIYNWAQFNINLSLF